MNEQYFWAVRRRGDGWIPEFSIRRTWTAAIRAIIECLYASTKYCYWRRLHEGGQFGGYDAIRVAVRPAFAASGSEDTERDARDTPIEAMEQAQEKLP